MLAAVLAGLVQMSLAVKPPDYTDKSLCDLWAGAQCHQLECGQNAKDRCAQESKRCRGLSRRQASKDKAAKVSACAKALLKTKCGDPMPTECSGVDGP
jgi:hypothetical protein